MPRRGLGTIETTATATGNVHFSVHTHGVQPELPTQHEAAWDQDGRVKRRGLGHLEAKPNHSGGYHINVLTKGASAGAPVEAEAASTSLPPLASPKTGTVPSSGNLSFDQRSSRRPSARTDFWCSPSEYWEHAKRSGSIKVRRSESPRGKCRSRNLESTLYWNLPVSEGQSDISGGAQAFQSSPRASALASLAGY